MSLDATASDPAETTIAAVLTTHDRVDLVQRALASVLAQSRVPNEVVVVDDGSTDGTAEHLAAAYPSVVVVEQEQRGAAAARNRGVLSTQAEWIAFLDSDDEWAPRKIEQQLQVLSQTGRLVCHTGEDLRDASGTSESEPSAPKRAGRIYADCLAGAAVSLSTAMVHRSVFDEIGMFDEELQACDDYDLWLRVSARYPVTLIEAPLVTKHVGHPDQLSRTMWGLDRFRIRALERAWRTLQLAPDERVATLEVLIQKLGLIVEGARDRQRDDLLEDLEHRVPHYERLLLLERIGLGLEW